jgi:hypothetical protein
MKTTSVIAACVAALLSVILLSNAGAQSRARTIPRSLDQLIEESEVIVHGYVVSAKLEPHPQLRNLKTIVVSMSVKDVYKGSPRKSLVFRQYVWDSDSRQNASEYLKGQEMILLVRPVSEYGLTSPAGLEQGRFRIQPDQQGRPTAINGRGNVGLFENMDAHARKQGLQLSARTATILKRREAGPVPLKDLEETIRTFARTR